MYSRVQKGFDAASRWIMLERDWRWCSRRCSFRPGIKHLVSLAMAQQVQPSARSDLADRNSQTMKKSSGFCEDSSTKDADAAGCGAVAVDDDDDDDATGAPRLALAVAATAAAAAAAAVANVVVTGDFDADGVG